MGRKKQRAIQVRPTREGLRELLHVKGFQGFQQSVSIIQSRIGESQRTRLAWVVGAVQRKQREMTPGDWANFRLELAVFVATERDGFLEYSGGIATPSDVDTREILQRFFEAIAKVVRRESVPLGRFASDVELHWLPQRGRFYEKWRSGGDWPARAMRALGPLLVEQGHLVRECPASAPWGGKNEICGTWFVAARPKQDYCSPTCQSRAATRAHRAGTETAAVKKQKEG